MAEGDDPLFEALWSRVLEAWDDDKTHNALLEYALREQRLPDAAGRYRALTGDPDKGAKAKKRLDAIVLAATNMLFSMKTPKREKMPWQITATAFAVFVLIVGYLAYAILRAHR